MARRAACRDGDRGRYDLRAHEDATIVGGARLRPLATFAERPRRDRARGAGRGGEGTAGVAQGPLGMGVEVGEAAVGIAEEVDDIVPVMVMGYPPTKGLPEAFRGVGLRVVRRGGDQAEIGAVTLQGLPDHLRPLRRVDPRVVAQDEGASAPTVYPAAVDLNPGCPYNERPKLCGAASDKEMERESTMLWAVASAFFRKMVSSDSFPAPQSHVAREDGT